MICKRDVLYFILTDLYIKYEIVEYLFVNNLALIVLYVQMCIEKETFLSVFRI